MIYDNNDINYKPMIINQSLSGIKKYFLLALGIVIISFFLFIIINPNSIFPLTFFDFFIPFIALMIYVLILLKNLKSKTGFIVLIFLAFLSIFLMIFGGFYYHFKYLFVFSLIWFIPFFIFWYGITKIKELNKLGKFGCLLVAISIFGQFIIYLYGPCLGVFGHLNKYLCPESSMFLFYILGLIWFFIIIGLSCIIFGKKDL